MEKRTITDLADLKAELEPIVYNTLDFCGSAYQASVEHCKDMGIEAQRGMISKAAFELTQDYYRGR